MFLLKLKHWQLFGLLIGAPIIIEIIAVMVMVSLKDPTVMLIFFPIIMLTVIVIFFGWFYVLGTNLHKKLPETAKMNLTRFKVFLFFPVVYMISIAFFIIWIFKNMSSGIQPNPAILFLILPVHLFSIFCIFYCLYFNAKALKTVENQKPLEFKDFVGEFLLIWFLPIGIWFIQPRINKLFDETAIESNATILDDNF